MAPNLHPILTVRPHSTAGQSLPSPSGSAGPDEPFGLPRHTTGSCSSCCYQNPQIPFCKTALQPLVPHLYFFFPCHLYRYDVCKVKLSSIFQFQNFSKLFFFHFIDFCRILHQNNWILLLFSKFLLHLYFQHLQIWFVSGPSELRNGWSPPCPQQRVWGRWSLGCLPIQATL